jgi:competence protein ComEA
MTRFTPSERRSLALATVLVVLATAARLLLAPGPTDYAWTPAGASRDAETIAEVRRAVADTLADEAEASRPLAPGERIDLNRASGVQLQRLPGVGPARAAAILGARREGGPFGSVEDLGRIPGVGPGLIERWRPVVALSGPGAGAASGSGTAPRAGASGRGDRVDLNRALPKELEQITGIGPVTAGRIVEERRRRGRFRSLDDLLEIPGIGPGTLERLRAGAYVR